MASFAYFKKIDEDNSTVRYNFGPERDDMHRSLIFDKENKRPLLEDKNEDHQFFGTATAIFRLFNEAGIWPEHGVHAS
jgi:hypothetical protein